MSTIVINANDRSSVKLFLDLAKKLNFKARVLTDEQNENLALLTMMEERSSEESLPIECALNILAIVK